MKENHFLLVYKFYKQKTDCVLIFTAVSRSWFLRVWRLTPADKLPSEAAEPGTHPLISLQTNADERINSEKVPSGVLLFPDWEIESSINSLTLGLNEDARRVSAHAATFLQLSGQKELIFTALLRIHHSDICPSGTWHPLVLNSSSSSSSRTKDTEKFSALFSWLQKSANGVLIQTTPPRGTRRTPESCLDYI